MNRNIMHRQCTYNARIYDINQRSHIFFEDLFLGRMLVVAARETTIHHSDAVIQNTGDEY
jgi:hypothetical protein